MHTCALADDTDRYEWALVSGGPPRVPTGHGCRTYRHTTNNSGLWILTRVPSPDGKVVDDVRKLAKDIGFDIAGTFIVLYRRAI